MLPTLFILFMNGTDDTAIILLVRNTTYAFRKAHLRRKHAA